MALSKERQNAFKLHSFYSDDVFQDIFYQLATANCVDCRFLTQGGLHAQALLAMSGDKRRRRINRTLLAKLSIALPIASEVPIRELLRLRDREREAFVRFRVALNQMANEVGAQDEESLERTASQIYEDVLRPKLAELDQRVKAAKRDLIRAPLATAEGIVGVLCFGVFSGLLSAEMTEVVRALGLSKIVYDVGAKSVDLMDLKKHIRQDELYYLWEVKRLRP